MHDFEVSLKKKDAEIQDLSQRLSVATDQISSHREFVATVTYYNGMMQKIIKQLNESDSSPQNSEQFTLQSPITA